MIKEVLLGLCLALVSVWTAPAPESGKYFNLLFKKLLVFSSFGWLILQFVINSISHKLKYNNQLMHQIILSFQPVSLTLSDPVVVLKDGGSIRGQYMKVKGSDKVVEQFLGIPYAQPPIGPLRLAAPKPLERWEGIRNAVEHPVM